MDGTSKVKLDLKEYLDDRFNNIIDKIDVLSGKISTVISEHEAIKKDLEWVKRHVKYLWIALFVGTFLWVKESREIIWGMAQKFLGF